MRFGLHCKRDDALKYIARKSVTADKMVTQGPEACLDEHFESWWEELERAPLPKKWDGLVGLFGFPASLNRPPWRFDRAVLEEFDGVRHNAVHHDAQAIRLFDLNAFAQQLSRAQLVWLVEIASCLNIKIPAKSMFAGK